MGISVTQISLASFNYVPRTPVNDCGKMNGGLEVSAGLQKGKERGQP